MAEKIGDDSLQLNQNFSEAVFEYFHNFGNKIQKYPFLFQKAKYSPTEYNADTKAVYAEIFSWNNTLQIKTSKGIMPLFDSNQSIKNNFVVPLYQTINLNKLNSQIYEFCMFNKVQNLIELKLNKDIYKQEKYIRYIMNKNKRLNQPFLLTDTLEIGTPNYFHYNEIDIEISPICDILFEQLSQLLTEMTFNDIIKQVKSTWTLSDIIKNINNTYMLKTINYFNILFTGRLPLGDYRANYFFNFDKIVAKFAHSEYNRKSNKISSSEVNENNVGKLYDQIKGELERKEKVFKEKIQLKNSSSNIFRELTHIYINDKTMTKREIELVEYWLRNQSQIKLFAWNLSPDETRKSCLKKIAKIGSVPNLKNLNIYIKIK